MAGLRHDPNRVAILGESVAATLTVPLFPLPRTVLFPAVRLPFYVFEERYRAMLRDVLDGPGLLGIPQVLPGFEASLDGSPPYARVFGVGQVADYVTHSDGTSHIEVVGVHRVRLLDEITEDVYRRARVQVLREPDAPDDVADDIQDRLGSAVRSLLPLAVPAAARDPLERLLANAALSLAALVNTLATVLVADVRMRQRLLETQGVEPRARRLAAAIDDIRHSLLERATTDAPEEPGDDA